ncbi:MAG: hypothetical protein AVDCRST_MAG93-8004, partial [uncultured Chloroflexia bacterium]
SHPGCCARLLPYAGSSRSTHRTCITSPLGPASRRASSRRWATFSGSSSSSTHTIRRGPSARRSAAVSSWAMRRVMLRIVAHIDHVRAMGRDPPPWCRVNVYSVYPIAHCRGTPCKYLQVDCGSIVGRLCLFVEAVGWQTRPRSLDSVCMNRLSILGTRTTNTRTNANNP